jgi:protein-disulfide isomerase
MSKPVPPSSPAAGRNVRLVRLGALIALAAVVVIAAIVLSGRGGDEAATTPAAAPATATQTASVDLNGIPQDGIVLGNPAAPIRVVEFADLQCPFCREFALSPTMKSIIDGPVRAGAVRLEFRSLAFLGPDSVTAAQMVEAAGRQDRLWQVVEQLYAHQGAENSGWLTKGLQRQVLGSVAGLDAAKLNAERDSASVTDQLDAAKALAKRHGVSSTPSFLVGRGDALKTVGTDGLPDALTAELQNR